MKFKYIFLLFITVVIPALFTSCSEDNPVTTIPIDSATFIYPLHNGNYWKYNITINYSDFEPDTIKKYFPDEHGSAKVTVLYDTIINSISTKCLFEEFTSGTSYREARYYYYNTDTAFLLYAQRGMTSGFLPQKIEPVFFHVFDPPRKVLLYPVVTGRHWKIDTSSNAVKTYLGFENISTQTGTISCMKTIRSYINPIDPLILDYYNYYSSKGLVKEHVILNDILVSTPQFPEGLGTADITGETILTEYNINP